MSSLISRLEEAFILHLGRFSIQNVPCLDQMDAAFPFVSSSDRSKYMEICQALSNVSTTTKLVCAYFFACSSLSGYRDATYSGLLASSTISSTDLVQIQTSRTQWRSNHKSQRRFSWKKSVFSQKGWLRLTKFSTEVLVYSLEPEEQKLLV